MKSLLLVLFVFSIGPTFAQTPTPIPGVIALAGIDPTLPTSELNMLDATVKGASFVAIGETVHGSGGFVSMEHRISKYLIEEKGFRLLLIENPILRSRGMTDWLQDCARGITGEAPIEALYQPIEQDRTFFNYLCAFNQKHPRDPVRYRGMDIWDRPWEWQSTLETLNQKLKLGAGSLLATTRAHCFMHNENSWANYNTILKTFEAIKKIPDSDYLPCNQALQDLRTLVQSKLAESCSESTRYDLFLFAEAVDSADGYEGDYEYAFQDNGFGPEWDSRDHAQARNEFNIWQQEGKKKTIIITHSSHAAKDESPSDWWKSGLGAIHSGISFLRSIDGMKNRVRTIGLTGYDVTGVQGNFLAPTSPLSLDLKLHTAGYTVAYVDPLSDFIKTQDRWWIENENSTDGYPDGVFMVIKDNFDALFFVDTTHEGPEIQPWYSVWNW